MKIYPINNYPVQNNTKLNFKGEFVQTKALSELMKYSNPACLIRFKEIIEQIKKVPDNIFYWVNKRYTECETLGPDTYIDVTFSLYQQTGKDIKTRKYVRAIYDNVPYSTKLIEINAELEELYKDKINLKTKDNLLDTINGLLLQNQPFDLKDTTYEE